MIKMKNLFLVVLGTLSFVLVKAQTSSVSGILTDEKTQETLPGVTVICGNSNNISSLDGNYKLTGLPAGDVSIIFKMVGFAEKKVQVNLKPGQQVVLNIKMSESAESLNEVVVETEARRESLTAMMLLQKNSITVSDGISGDAIRRSPDKNTGEVLKRISGTTLQNNRFVIIRGLNERYNTAFVDGSPLPSSESDKKAFSFDIFPAGMIDNLSVTKSASPDLPSDFSGGVIRITTKSIPESLMTSISLSTGIIPGSTFNSWETYKGGKYDLLGFDDGTRDLPELAPTQEARGFNNNEKAEQAKLMKNDWGSTRKAMASPNPGFQISHGNNWSFGNWKAGYIAGATYSYTARTTNTTRREYDSALEEEKPVQQFELIDNDYSENILAGVFANASIKYGKNHSIHFKNLFSENSEDKVVKRTGIRDYEQEIRTEERSSAKGYTQNKFFLNQVSGENSFQKAGVTFNWNIGKGEIERIIPSLKRTVYTRAVEKNKTEVDTPFEASIPTSGTSPSSGGNIFHSTNHEQIRNISSDLSKKFNFSFGLVTLKGGIFYQERDREFAARQFGYSRYSQGSKVIFDRSLLYLPEDKIFGEENLGVIQPYIPAAPGQPSVKGIGGFKLEETTKLNDAYTAGSRLKAAYLMEDFKLKEIIRLSGGARVESYNQFLTTFEDDGDTINIDTTTIDILPSGNLVVSPTKELNIRLCYGQTVSRPEFRELAPFGFFDFVTFYSVRGNPDLKRALVHNFDIRLEYFGKRNQMVSATAFYKKYLDPIEMINRVDVPREVYFTNVEQGKNYGLEFEFRLGLFSFLPDQTTSPLANFFVTSNIAIIKSEVNVDSIAGALTSVRPLQGQSPYVVNGGVNYQDDKRGFTISILGNKIGRRLAIVGNTQEPDTYENSRLVLDAQVEKKFGKRFNAKMSVKDIIAQPVVFYQDLDNDGKAGYNGKDNILSESKTGCTVTAGVSFTF